MYARFTAFSVWALLAGSIVFWSLKLAVNPLPAPAHALAVLEGAPSRVDLSRLLGSAPVAEALDAPAAAESRFHLVGVVAPKAGARSDQGVALISTEGKPARPYRVGAVVDADLSLLSVTSRSAALGLKGHAEPAKMVLQLVPPNTAVNSPIVNGGAVGNKVDQQNGAVALPTPVNRLAPVKMTQGLNPVPEAANDQQAETSVEDRRGAVANRDATR